MITFYGYAVKMGSKYLGYNPKRNKRDKLFKKQYYKRPKFPVVNGEKSAQEEANGHLGEVVKVKLTMEEVRDA